MKAMLLLGTLFLSYIALSKCEGSLDQPVFVETTSLPGNHTKEKLIPPPAVERRDLGTSSSSLRLEDNEGMLPGHYLEAYHAWKSKKSYDWEAFAWWRDEPELLEYYLQAISNHLEDAPEKIAGFREAMRARGEGVKALSDAIISSRPKQFPGPDALAWQASDFPGLTDWSAVVLSSYLTRQRDHRIEHSINPIDSPYTTFRMGYFRENPLLFPPEQALMVLSAKQGSQEWPEAMLNEVRIQAANALIERVRLKDTYNALEGAFLSSSQDTGLPVPSAGMREISADWASYQDAIPHANIIYFLNLQGILQSYGFETDPAVFNNQ